MPDEDDALIDDDSIDKSQEGHIYAFNDDDGDDFDTDFFVEADNDDQRRTYLADTLEGKSEASTIHEARNIKSTVLNGLRIWVLTLVKDDEMFTKRSLMSITGVKSSIRLLFAAFPLPSLL